MTKKDTMSLTAINNTLKKLASGMNRQFKEMRQQFKHIDRRVEQVDRRFEQVDRRFEQVGEDFAKLFGQHHDLERYVKEEVATKSELKHLKDYVSKQFDRQNRNFQRQDSEIAANRSAIRRLETHVGLNVGKP
jgi:archaellum component FlaC